MDNAKDQVVTSVWRTLRWTFGLIPIAAGADKFFNLLTYWPKYVAPLLSGLSTPPMRPTATVVPTPVARMFVGYTFAASAYIVVCVALTRPPVTAAIRITATIAVSHQARLPGGGKVRVAGRRPATGGDVRWSFVFDAGLDPDDPGLRAQAEQILEDLRRQTGL